MVLCKLGTVGSVLILFGINLINYIDRYTVAAVVADIQNSTTSGFDDDISDASAALLQTLFIVTYMVASPIFGYFGDRISRTLLLMIGILIWSAATFASSFAPNFILLCFFRSLVGIGEASYATISPTLIADLYDEKTRTTVLAYYYVAIPVGSALGFILGGQFASAFGSWRWAFRITPAFGVILALAQYLFIAEPQRGASDGLVVHNEHHSIRAVFQDWKKIVKIHSFTWSTIGFTAVTFAAGGLAFWAPTFVWKITSSSGDPWSKDKSSFVFGAITCATGLMGTIAGAMLTRRLRVTRGDAEAIVCAVGLLVSVPLVTAALFLVDTSLDAMWVLLFFGECMLFLNWAPVAAILLSVSPPQLRSSAEGFQNLVSHMFGDAFSPLLIGAISDVISDKYNYDNMSGTPLKYSLQMCSVCILIGAVTFWWSARTLQADREAVVLALPSATGYAPLITDRDIPEVDPASKQANYGTAEGQSPLNASTSSLDPVARAYHYQSDVQTTRRSINREDDDNDESTDAAPLLNGKR
ncbi:spinster like protein [Capsaspora owczarzaki ATCC 30864]|uniref:Spinster like protein n=1 Tax=Capsaspora owczarzaki (strain ATCC 30864) TaxID=595528 RepID=A0A0D2WV82_CAPO3|nr:spinster like protein [Capsaspora owczarzaki ATCC 30864]KJE96038.1 spinster like protein [Capsaspora owczarzaki ATCC 30864]|eukprot:XP_004345161.2 spinster like protein [Capsaspora owczarzaki ATCC 30864]